MCEKNCLNCQFFCVYYDHPSLGFLKEVVSKKEREKIMQDKTFCHITRCKIDQRFYLYCYKGVWDENKLIFSINRWGESNFREERGKKLQEKLWGNIVTTERSDKNSRKNSCFYFKFQEGMLLEAAGELEKRETLQKETSADRRWIKWGVWATFFTALASIAVFVWSHYWK